MRWLSVLIFAAVIPETVSLAAPDRGRGSGPDHATDAVVHRLSGQVTTGTLLVSQGDCLAVRVYTRSPYTHVGAVVVRAGQILVYDACKSSGVRCQTLANYLMSQIEGEVHVLQPRRELSAAAAAKFVQRLDSQLGRPYSIRHHLTGESAEGVHCSEYVSDALAACGLIRIRNAANVSPASLVQGIVQSRVYTPAETFCLRRPTDDVPRASTWYGRLWQDTKTCTIECCRRSRAWFLCD